MRALGVKGKLLGIREGRWVLGGSWVKCFF